MNININALLTPFYLIIESVERKGIINYPDQWAAYWQLHQHWNHLTYESVNHSEHFMTQLQGVHTQATL